MIINKRQHNNELINHRVEVIKKDRNTSNPKLYYFCPNCKRLYEIPIVDDLDKLKAMTYQELLEQKEFYNIRKRWYRNFINKKVTYYLEDNKLSACIDCVDEYLMVIYCDIEMKNTTKMIEYFLKYCNYKTFEEKREIREGRTSTFFRNYYRWRV